MSFVNNIGFFDGSIRKIQDRGLTKSTEVPHCMVLVQQPVINTDSKKQYRNLVIPVWAFGPEAVEIMDKFEVDDRISLTYTLRAHMHGRMIAVDVTCLSLKKIGDSADRDTGDLSVLAPEK